jgi:hypothetical protein
MVPPYRERLRIVGRRLTRIMHEPPAFFDRPHGVW